MTRLVERNHGEATSSVTVPISPFCRFRKALHARTSRSAQGPAKNLAAERLQIKMRLSQMNRSVFHHLYSQSMHPLEMIDEHYRQALRTWLCGGCKRPRPGIGAVDVTVEKESTRSRAALNLVAGTGVAIARREVLFTLGVERVSRDLYLGNVLRRSGTPYEDLVTFRGRRALIVRGKKHVANGQCSECGHAAYFSMIGGRYLHGLPPPGHDLFESQLWGLVFSDEIARGLDLGSWKCVTHEVLPVRDKPLDGLGDIGAIADRDGSCGN